MIRILHSELQYKMGGIESFLLNLTKSFDLSEYQFDFLMRGKNDLMVNELERLGCRFYEVPQKRKEYITFIDNLLEREDYDIVHCHKNSCADIILPLIAKKHKKKIIIHSHNTQPSTPSIAKVVLHVLNKPIINSIADTKLACSEVAAAWMFYGAPNITIAKNGIITNDYKFSNKDRLRIREELGIDNDTTVIGNIGAFRVQKNHKFMIDIIKNLADKKVVLLLVGDGVNLEEIEKYAVSLDVKDKVIFAGQRKDISSILSCMDIFILPSLWEGLPMVCIEAQTSGVPMILSNNVSKMAKLNESVYFLDISSSMDWANKITDLIMNYSREDNILGIRNSGYDIRETAKTIKEIYKSFEID